MSTFLELCQEFHEQIGMSGSVSTVTGQTGMLERLVNWIVKADYQIQLRWTNWDFLWAEWTFTMATDTTNYSKPTLLNRFNTKTFWIDSGTDDAELLPYMDYETFSKERRHGNFDDGPPEMFTVKPDNTVLVSPSPDTATVGKIVTAEYWKKPVKLANNNDTSVIPAQFEQIIIAQARMYHAAYVHSEGKYVTAAAEHSILLKELEAHSLPGQKEQRTSTAVIPLVISVN